MDRPTMARALADQAETSDYAPASGTVTLASGQTAATVPITVTGDSSAAPELVVVSLIGPVGAGRGRTRYAFGRNPFDFWTKGVGLAHAFRFVDQQTGSGPFQKVRPHQTTIEP